MNDGFNFISILQNRVFERPNPKQLQFAIKELVKFFNPEIEGKVVAIDGKSFRSTLNLAILRRIGFNPAKPRTPEGMTTKKAQLRSILSQIFTERHFTEI